MNTLVINQVEQEGVRESYPVFAEIARRRAAVRKVLSNLTIPKIYRQELKAGRRVAKSIDRHATLTTIALWVMSIAFVVEVLMRG